MMIGVINAYSQQNDAYKWKQKADEQYAIFREEQDKQILSGSREAYNEERMYNSLLSLYNYYIQSDQLSQVYEENGLGTNLYVTEIANILKEVRPYFINAGVYYNEKQEYSKASLMFDVYSNYKNLSIFNDERVDSLTEDENEPIIKYYAIVCAIQADDPNKSIELLNRLIAEPYIANETYKESDLYEFLAFQYQQINDENSFIETLKTGAERFPNNKYFVPNLVNEYVRLGNNDEALEYLDRLIDNGSENPCDYLCVKASLLIHIKKEAEAETIYQQALKAEPNCGKALEGLGVLYILQAQNIKDMREREHDSRKQKEIDEEAIYYYERSLPYLKKYHEQLKENNADNYELRMSLTKLQNVYYNLDLLGVKKEKELKMTEKEMDSL